MFPDGGNIERVPLLRKKNVTEEERQNLIDEGRRRNWSLKKKDIK